MAADAGHVTMLQRSRTRCAGPAGVRTRSGEHLDADIVVTATGPQLVTLSEIEVVVDGEPVDFSATF